MTSDKLDKSDDLAERLNGLIIKNAGYYVSDSANANDEKGDHTSNPETATHTSDGKKRKVTDTSNGILQQKSLSNRTLLIVTTMMDPRIGDRISTCGVTPNTLVSPTTKEVITDAACSSAWVNWTPRHEIRMGRDGTTPGNCAIDVRYPQNKPPVLIGVITVSPTSGHSGSL